MIPIPPQYRILAACILAAVLVAAGFGAGWTAQGWKSDKALADEKASHNEQVRQSLKAERDGLASVLAEERALRTTAEDAANELRNRKDLDRNAADLSGELRRMLDANRRQAPSWSCADGSTARPAAGAASGAAAGMVPPQSDRGRLLEESATGFAAMAQHSMACDAAHRALTDYYDKARARLQRLGEAGRTIDP